MWTAVRLMAVCLLGLGSLFALRSGFLSHPPRPLPPTIKADIRASNVAPVNLTIETDDFSTANENTKKVVTVQKFRLAAFNANNEAPPEPKVSSPQPRARVHHLRHFHQHRGQKRHRRN